MYRWLVRSYEERKIEELSMQKCLKHTGIGFLWGILMMAAVIGIFALCGWYKIVGGNFNIASIYRFLMAYFVVAVGEEIVFRGIIFRLLDSQFNLWVALILSAFLFGAAHIINPNATVISTIGISLSSGVLFGLLFKYYRTLWVPIGIHWSWNFVQGTVSGCPVSGGASDYSILESFTSGPELFTGGLFIIREGFIATGVSQKRLWNVSLSPLTLEMSQMIYQPKQEITVLRVLYILNTIIGRNMFSVI